MEDAGSLQFLSKWSPDNADRPRLMRALKLAGRYQGGLVVQRLKALTQAKRAEVIGLAFSPGVLQMLISELGPSHAEPFPHEMTSAIDATLEHYPAVLVRLTLLEILVKGEPTSAGVIEAALFGHPLLRLDDDPKLVQPEFEQLGTLDSEEVTAGDEQFEEEGARAVSQSVEIENLGAESSESDGDFEQNPFDDLRLRGIEFLEDALDRLRLGRQLDLLGQRVLTDYCQAFESLVKAVEEATGETVVGDGSLTISDLRSRLELAVSRPYEDLVAFADVRSLSTIEVEGLTNLKAEAFRLSGVVGTGVEADAEIANECRAILDALRHVFPRRICNEVHIEVWFALKHGLLVLGQSATGSDGDPSEANRTAFPDGGEDDSNSRGSADEAARKSESPSSPELGAEDETTKPLMPVDAGALDAGRGSDDDDQTDAPLLEMDRLIGERQPNINHEGRLDEAATTNESSDTEPGSPAGSIGFDLLFGGRFAPLYWWLEAAKEEEVAQLEFPAPLARACALLGGCLTPYDDLAYGAAAAAGQLLEHELRTGSPALVIATALAAAGLAATGCGEFASLLVKTNFEAGWDSETRATLRSLCDLQLGGLSAVTTGDGSAESGDLAAVAVEVAWARKFREGAKHKRFNFQPATVVWQELVKVGGIHGQLGEAVEAVAEDHRDRLSDVEELLEDLERPRSPEDRIDKVARSTPRLHSQTVIDGLARRRLVEEIVDVMEHLRRWSVAVNSLGEGSQRPSGVPAVSSLSVASVGKAIQTIVDRLPPQAADLRASLKSIVNHSLSIAGTTVPASERCSADVWLSWELDLEPTVPTVESPHSQVGGRSLIADRGGPFDKLIWVPDNKAIRSKFEELLDRGDLVRAERVAAALLRARPELTTEIEWLLRSALETESSELHRLTDLIEDRLGTARSLGMLSEAAASNVLTDLQLARMVIGQSPDADVLMARARALNVHLEDLSTRLRLRADTLRSRLTEIRASQVDASPLVDHLLQRLEVEDFQTVEDQLARFESGDRASVVMNDLVDVRSFFPERVDKSAHLVPTDDLVRQLEAGASVGPFSFGGLVGAEQDSASTALRAWVDLCQLLPGDRSMEKISYLTPPIIRALGVSWEGSPTRPDRAPHTRGVFFLDFKGVKLSGSAVVSRFGSELLEIDLLRVMLAFDRSNARLLLERAAADTSGLQCLVIYVPAVLDSDNRRTLATHCRREARLLPVVDFAVFLELLTSPEERRFERLMALTLPFSWVNPYVPHVAGRVPREMFYGREDELRDIINRSGPSFVYGGRQLGKSALLRRAQQEIKERERDAVGIYLDLNEQGVGLFSEPESLWPALARELVRAQVMPETRSKVNFDRVKSSVDEWLGGKPTRRLLVLLDECDHFLEADFRKGFQVSQQIRGLMESLNRRCKVVLAGLNVVQRFERGTNHPMAHLASTCIEVGPLDGASAFRLTHEPLFRLGVRFADGDSSLIYKILAATNNQASLIQLVGERLLEQVRQQPWGPRSNGPTVTAELVDRLLEEADLRSEICRRFEWTISLDARYQVLAYRIAVEAREGWPRISAEDLLLLAQADWPAAFESMTSEEFGWFLRELETFGVLASSNGEWMLRSPSLVSLLGSPDEIKQRLKRISERSPESRLDPTKQRYPLRGSTHLGPLCGDQIAHLLSVGVGVLGSDLAGLNEATEVLQKVAIDRGYKLETFEIEESSSLPLAPPFVEPSVSIVVFRPDVRREIVASVTAELLKRWADRHKSDSLLWIIGRHDQGLWEELAELGASSVSLRSWDSSGLYRYFEKLDLAVSDSDIQEILVQTGGWHHQLDSAFAKVAKNIPEFLQAVRSCPSSVDSFLELAGVSLLDGARDLLTYLQDEEMSEQDIVEMFGGAVPSETVMVLQRAGVLVQGEQSLRLEPLVRAILVSAP